jgi:hypothetical protein
VPVIRSRPIASGIISGEDESRRGCAQWMTLVEHESVFADVTAVRTDQEGSTYAAYYHSDAFSRVDIYSTDGRRHALTPGGSELRQPFC